MPSAPQNSVAAGSGRLSDLQSGVLQLLTEVSGMAATQIDPASSFLELGFDSLLLVQVAQAIETRFGVKVSIIQLLEDISSAALLSVHLDRNVPADRPIASAAPALSTKPAAVPAAVAQHPLPNEGLVASPGRAISAAPSPAGNSVMERVMAQQLEIMRQQLEALRNLGKSVGAPELSGVPAPALATPHAASGPNAGLAVSSAPVIASEVGQGTYIPPFQPLQVGTKGGLTEAQQSYLNEFMAAFIARTGESKRLAQSYRGVLADARCTTGFKLLWKEMVYPIVGARTEGARMWDVDGNEYVDITMGFGVHLFGHSPPFIIEALKRQMGETMSMGPQTALAGKVAALVCELSGFDRAVFCNSGTEGMIGLIRAARSFTRRNRVVIFNGSYHGCNDVTLARAVSGGASPKGMPAAPGVDPKTVEDVIVLDYGKPESLAVIEANAGELAAVLVEPVQSRQPWLQPKEFLQQLREITRRHGVVLVFDETITGFRSHGRGAQQFFDVQPDVAMYGKHVGGGMPIGVVAGRRAFMDTFDGGAWQYGDDSYPDKEKTLFTGTYFKHPLAMAAALAVLTRLKSEPGLLDDVNRRTERLVEAINKICEKRNAPFQLARFGSLFKLRWASEPPLKNLLFQQLLSRGVYYPIETNNCFLSTAHSDGDVEQIVKAFDESIEAMRSNGFFFDGPIPKPEPSVAEAAPPPAVAPPAPPTAAAASKVAVRLPLTDGQKGLLLLAQVSDEAHRSYQEAVGMRLKGALDLPALSKAINTIVARHEALRTTFPADADGQWVHPRFEIEIPVTDLTAWTGPQQEARLRAALETHEKELMDLERGPLIRVRLYRLHPKDHAMVVTIHHLVADGHSYGIFFQELRELYSGWVRGEPVSLSPPQQYRDYVEWLTEQSLTVEALQSKDYWLARLSGELPVLELPTDRPRPAAMSYRGARLTATLQPELVRKLRKLGARHHSTLFSVLLAGYQLWLHRLSGQDDVIVAIPSMGQPLPGKNDVFGYRVNVLPIRSRLAGSPSFSDYLKEMRQAVLEATQHQLLFFGRLLGQLGIRRDPGRMPLFSTLFNLDRASAIPPWAGVEISEFPFVARNPGDTARFDIAVNLYERVSGDVLIELDFNTDLFDRSTVERWLSHLVTLFAGAAENPELGVRSLPLLEGDERRKLVEELNQTAREYPVGQRMQDLFEEQVRKTPGACALVYCGPDGTGGAERWSYEKLNRRANQLADRLRQEGVGPDVLVGVCHERSPELVVCLLGVLKAGGAYVPIDPNYPQQRVAFMLEDTAAPVLLTQKSLVGRLPAGVSRAICLDEEETVKDLAARPEGNPGPGRKETGETDLAYVIFTSGSTGKPKGVALEHRNAVRFIQWAKEVFTGEELSRVLFSTSVCFDLSVYEVFVTLSSGGAVVMVENALALSSLSAREEITLINTVPSAAAELVRLKAIPGSVRVVNLAGEALSVELVKELYGIGTVKKVYDLYGPSEDTTYSTYTLRRADGPATIGRPIANTQAYVMDGHRQLVPFGVPGELYLGGDGLARGYLNRPELTAERFVENPLEGAPSRRLYRTGDLVRYLADGNLEYLGRLDQQVKIRGFRIELGEIESELRGHPQIADAVVMARQDTPGTPKLVAYVLPRQRIRQSGMSEQEWHDQQGTRFEEVYKSAIQESGGQLMGKELEAQLLKATRITDLESHAAEYYRGSVERVLAGSPKRVWEVGCGTGELVLQVAPLCEEYWATDLSQGVVDHLKERLAKAGGRLARVQLRKCLADDFSAVRPGSLDLVILNSVCQYFPDAAYLVRVISSAAKALAQGGRIFLGDIHDQSLLRETHLAALLKSVPGTLSLEDLSTQIAQRVELEDRLAVSPEFFSLIADRVPQIGHIELLPRRGRLQNEVSQFHYDVMIHLGTKAPAEPAVLWHGWQEEEFDLSKLRALLSSGRGTHFGFKRVPNARLCGEQAGIRRLSGVVLRGTVGDLRADMANARGVHPEDLWALGKELGLGVDISWVDSERTGGFDVVFTRDGSAAGSRMPYVFPSPRGQSGVRIEDLANNPSRGLGIHRITALLRDHLRQRLAEYMIPSAFVFLDRLPLSPNGKVDRKALPAPERSRPEDDSSYQAPVTTLEKSLSEIWARILNLPKVGLNDNIFDIGGDSILILRISLEAKQAGLPLPPKLIYQHQTVLELARAIEEEGKAAGAREEDRRRKVSSMTPEQVRALLHQKKKLAGRDA